MARPNKDFFTYGVNFLALAPAAIVNQTLQFDASSDFEWVLSAYDCDQAGAAHSISARDYPLVNLLITPTDSSAQLMSVTTPVVSIFGNGENVFVLPAPRIIPARSAITFQATNRSAATTYNLYLSLIGIKKYLA